MQPRKLKESEKKIVASSQGWRCNCCNIILPSSYQIDHIIPYCINADDGRDNLSALCPSCHSIKTQKENSRIISFKKLRTIIGNEICWFCLNKYADNHACDNVLKDIIFERPTSYVERPFDKFMKTTEESMSKLSIDTTLRIKLSSDFIFVNNYFTRVYQAENHLNEIADAVFVATRTKKDSGRYDTVEITFEDFEEEIPEELINYIDENLHELLSQRIFDKNKEIQYIYNV